MKKILLPLLLLFCVSDIQISNKTATAQTLIADADFTGFPIADNGLCKPTGVETVTYSEGKTEPAPEKKRTVAKLPKRKPAKKAQPKKA